MVFESEDLQTTVSQKISSVTHQLAAPRGQVSPQTSADNSSTDALPVAKPQIPTTNGPPPSTSTSDDGVPPPPQSHHATADICLLENTYESGEGQKGRPVPV